MTAPGIPNSRRIDLGFTLIELLVVLVVLAVLVGMVAPTYLDRVTQAREAVLKQNLAGIRTAIDQFYRDKGRYPVELNELVEARYIRAIPEDPITQKRTTWKAITPAGVTASSGATGALFDVKSGAIGVASDGTSYAEW